MGRNSENKGNKINQINHIRTGRRAFFTAGVLLAMLVAAAAFMMRENLPDKAVISLDVDTHDTSHVKAAEHIILSMGEKPGSVSLSWKGGGAGKEFIKVAESEDLLKKSKPQEGEKDELFDGGYQRYSVYLDGIEPGSRYYYEIGDESSFGPVGDFTAPETSETMKFLYLGDVQFEDSVKEYKKWSAMVERIYADEPDLDFAVIGGDMVNDSWDRRQWEAFLDNCGVFSKLPLMTVPGNHEGKKSNSNYRKIFALPRNGPEESGENSREDFYFFDYGKCRFLMTDSSFLTQERKAQMGKQPWTDMENSAEKWMAESLSESRGLWKIAVIHHPVYGMHDSETVSPQLREGWENILTEGDTDMVLCGHQHMYMRTKSIDGIVYVMGNSGSKISEFFNGFNAPTYSRGIYASGPNYQIVTASGRTLKMTSYNKNGLIIDETTVNKSLGFHILEFLRRNQIIV